MKKTIFISAGEVSGDIHGSYLAKELFKLNHNLNILGFGSVEMSKVGVDILNDFVAYSGVGLIENIPALFKANKSYKIAKKTFSEKKIDLLILIDNQGFNLKLADLAKKNNILVYYYIGPQEWIWGFKNGKKRIISKIDKLFCIFQKEYLFYQDYPQKVEYIGHPLLDIIKKIDKNDAKNLINIHNKKIVGLMAGSRKHEISSLLPIFVDTAIKLKKDNIEAIIITNDKWQTYIKTNFDLKGLKLFSGSSCEYMQACDLIIAASGTVTLEAVILDIPIIACYKLNKISYSLAKVLIKLKYFSLPNILADKKVIPEFIQDQVNTDNLYLESIKFLNNQDLVFNTLDNFVELKKLLHPYGSIKKAAKIIIDDIN